MFINIHICLQNSVIYILLLLLVWMLCYRYDSLSDFLNTVLLMSIHRNKYPHVWTKLEFQQRYRKFKKKNQGVEEINKWTENFTREVQHQTWSNKRNNKGIQKQVIWNYLVREAKRKKNLKE